MIKCVKESVKFTAGDFSLNNASWTDRPVEVDSDQIGTLIQNVYTTWEIADRLKISKSSIENYLHQLGYVNGFDIWILHKLSKKKKTPSLPYF